MSRGPHLPLVLFTLVVAPAVAAQDTFVTSPLEPLAETERLVGETSDMEHETVLNPEDTLLGITLSRASGVPLGILDVGDVTLDREVSAQAEQEILVPFSNVLPALTLNLRAPPASFLGLLDHTSRATQSVEADLPVDLDPDTVRLALALYANGFTFDPHAAILTDDRVAGIESLASLVPPEESLADLRTLPVQNAFAAATLGMEQARPVQVQDLADVRVTDEVLSSYLYVPRLTEGAVLGGIILRNQGLPVDSPEVIGRAYETVGVGLAAETVSVPLQDVFAALVLGNPSPRSPGPGGA